MDSRSEIKEQVNKGINTVVSMTDKEEASLKIGRDIAAWEAKGNKVKQCGNNQSESSKTLRDKNNEKWVISQDKKAAKI